MSDSILYPHQVSAVDRGLSILNAHSWCYLNMETRTGKTLTALTLAQRKGAKKVLFLTRKRAIDSVKNDYEYGGFDYEFVVTNYEQMPNLADKYDFVISDEHHNFGSFPKPSKRTLHLAKICKTADNIVLLSATPTPESFSQMYHQLKVLGNRCPFISKYKNFYAFARDYVRPKEIFLGSHTVKNYSDCDYVDISPYSVQVTQKKAGITTQIEDIIVDIPTPSETLEIYEAIKKHGAHGDKVYDSNAAVMSACHQLCGGTLKGHPELTSDFKTKYILDNFKQKKIAIFYKYIAEGDMLREAFDTTDDPDEFNHNKNLVFVGQIASIREGVNIKTADCLIMYNIDFSAVCYWQARNRLQSMDRTAPAEVYWLFSDIGLEKRIHDVVQTKKTFTTRYFR